MLWISSKYCTSAKNDKIQESDLNSRIQVWEKEIKSMHKCLYHQRSKSTSFCYCMTLHTLRNTPDTVRRGPHNLKAPKSI